MTDTTIATDKPPTDPRPPCEVCGSLDHTPGLHDSSEPSGSGGTSAPTGHHDS